MSQRSPASPGFSNFASKAPKSALLLSAESKALCLLAAGQSADQRIRLFLAACLDHCVAGARGHTGLPAAVRPGLEAICRAAASKHVKSSTSASLADAAANRLHEALVTLLKAVLGHSLSPDLSVFRGRADFALARLRLLHLLDVASSNPHHETGPQRQSRHDDRVSTCGACMSRQIVVSSIVEVLLDHREIRHVSTEEGPDAWAEDGASLLAAALVRTLAGLHHTCLADDPRSKHRDWCAACTTLAAPWDRASDVGSQDRHAERAANPLLGTLLKAAAEYGQAFQEASGSDVTSMERLGLGVAPWSSIGWSSEPPPLSLEAAHAAVEALF